MDNSKVFETLFKVNVNEFTEVKSTGGTTLTYLSWANAWAEVKKRFEDASDEIVKFDGLPYVFDPKTGYMVYTTVTIAGLTHEMWLPVMDGNNKAMLDHPYEVKTKYKTYTVQAATMFDINKTVMRCLTKNLAMFGLGLYIYAGEDLPQAPEEVKEEPKAQTQSKKAAPKKAAPVPVEQPAAVEAPEAPEAPVENVMPSKETKAKLIDICKKKSINIIEVCKLFELNDTATEATFLKAIEYCEKYKKEGANETEARG